MTISGFTFIRNGIKLKYPFVESINSILPVCEEMIVVVGNSDDGTREAIEQIDSDKIKIIDTVWDETIRTGGKILARQTDIAFDAITGDWGFYLQGDEVVHENELPAILSAAEYYLPDLRVDGLLFEYHHFYGNYEFIAKPKTRGTYPSEVRIIRNDKRIRSFRDAQGFRKYRSFEEMNQGITPEPLRVKKIPAHIFHYGKVRGPKDELERSKQFHRLWHGDEWVNEKTGDLDEYKYQPGYPLVPFTKSHPAAMRSRIQNLNWEFKYDEAKNKIRFTHRIMNFIEQKTGWRPFSFKNYKLLK